jgi:hypothetical protein
MISFPNHALNKQTIHEIIVDDSLEQTKTFDMLDNSMMMMASCNKTMKVVKSFINKSEKYKVTVRNGFVSAMSMAYNYHMPLVLDPQDIWLAIV